MQLCCVDKVACNFKCMGVMCACDAIEMAFSHKAVLGVVDLFALPCLSTSLPSC